MKTQPRIYKKDLARRVTFRLDDALAEFVTRQAESVGRTPSDWVRMVLHSYMHAVAGAVGLATAISPDPEIKASSAKAAQHENQAIN